MNASRAAIVIGGGPAGLVAAARLAEGNVATTLVEASAQLGGRAASERVDGFALNQGPHALYVGGPAMRELGALGIDPPRWNPVSHRSFFVRGGRPRRLPRGAAALTRWYARVLRGSPEELAGLSVAEWLRRELPGEEARRSAAALVRLATFVADHESFSADAAAIQLKTALYPGVRYIRGGWQTLVDLLAAAAERRGATLRTRAGVRALRREAGAWQVELDGEALRADLVVLAAGGPEAAAELLGAAAPAAPGPAAEASTLDLGLERLPRRGRTFAIGVERPTYLSLHSEGRRGPALLSMVSYVRSPRETLEEMADAVQPGWRERATLQRFLPRMVPVTAISTPASGGLAGRPAVDRGDGLYLAGDWVGPEGWLVDAALASGAAAAAAALRRPAEAPTPA